MNFQLSTLSAFLKSSTDDFHIEISQILESPMLETAFFLILSLGVGDGSGYPTGCSGQKPLLLLSLLQSPLTMPTSHLPFASPSQIFIPRFPSWLPLPWLRAQYVSPSNFLRRLRQLALTSFCNSSLTRGVHPHITGKMILSFCPYIFMVYFSDYKNN